MKLRKSVRQLVSGLVMLLLVAMLSACKSTPMYPRAQAYDKNVHGFDKGSRAMLMCTNLPSLQIRKQVELDIKSYVTKDPFEKVSNWYREKLSGWREVTTTGGAKLLSECPTGISYVSPENCRPGDCPQQLYVLNEGPSETWIVTLSLK